MTSAPVTATQSPAERKRQLRNRNYAIAAALLAFVLLIFLVTLVQLSANIAAHP